MSCVEKVKCFASARNRFLRSALHFTGTMIIARLPRLRSAYITSQIDQSAAVQEHFV